MELKKKDRVQLTGQVISLSPRTTENGYVFPKRGYDKVLARKYVVGLNDSERDWWFYTPAQNIHVDSGGNRDYDKSQWIDDQGRCRLRIGDTISIKGTVEQLKSKYGVKLSRVKLLGE